MTVTVQWVTPDVDAMIARIARVSNPDNQGSQSIEGLLRYMMRNGHVSPFEMAHACLEIETTRDIGRQILRHRSFSFQEFCVAADTEITLELPGTSKRSAYKRTIEHLYKLQESGKKLPAAVRVFDETTRTFVRAGIREVFKTGVKPVFRLTLANGRILDCTKEHRLLTTRGFLPLEDAVGLRMVGSTAAMTKADVSVACNGVPAHRDVHWSAVEKVEYLGEQMTYDMEVDHQSHNYVANGIVTHNSQRYQTAAVLPVAPPREARMQDKANRQSSLPCDDRDVQMGWLAQQERIQSQCRAAYEWALAHGIAKEQARALLPEGLTTTRMYMVGSFRSWVHYLQQRLHPSTQAEHREIAEQVRDVLEVYAPITMSAFFGRSGVVARGC